MKALTQAESWYSFSSSTDYSNANGTVALSAVNAAGKNNFDGCVYICNLQT